MLPYASDNPDGEPGFFAKILNLAPGLVVKLQRVFTTMQNPEGIDAVIATAQKRGYFEDGGDMFLLLAHKFQSMTMQDVTQGGIALDGLSDDTLRMLGTHRAEVQNWMEIGIIQLLRNALVYARSSEANPEEERIPDRQRGFLEGDEEIFVYESGRLTWRSDITLETLEEDFIQKLETTREELLLLRKIGKIHKTAYFIPRARQQGYLIPDEWEGLMTYLLDAQGCVDEEPQLAHITDDTLALAGVTRTEVQSWFRHIPG